MIKIKGLSEAKKGQAFIVCCVGGFRLFFLPLPYAELLVEIKERINFSTCKGNM